MSSDSNQPKRKKRFSADEARAALLEAGAQLLEERGFGRGLGRITLGDAVIKSGVPRPSAYRLYTGRPEDPQIEFRRELILYLLDNSVVLERSDAGFEEATEAMAALEHLIDSGDGSQIATALRETIRLATNNLWATATMREAASRAAALSLALDPAPDVPLVEAYRTRRARVIERDRQFYLDLLSTFGLRLRSGFSVDELASHNGLAYDQVWDGWLIYGHEPSIKRPTGVDGAVVAWTPFGVTIEGLFLVMTEPDPNATAAADLRTWLDQS
ncbi:MAG: hypothetical protein AAF962_22540 [Actinomycetota bacterium]